MTADMSFMTKVIRNTLFDTNINRLTLPTSLMFTDGDTDVGNQ